ncbi:transcriptional regulator [Paenibacillus senegalimassiliensis]|uniref:transcriptional regulator n=1 Tax=Paenibacillus senegalimassiliensis TaxID=1737426 RepID=UPI00073E3CBD|nr:transcriptional regulator [Paenibacillus senegalimassiliensis]
MQQTKIKRGTFQHVESEIYAYHETRKEILRLKNEILHGGKSGEDENVGGGRSNLPGDPTGRTAVLLTSHKKLEQLQTIADAVEAVYRELTPEKQRLIRLRYWTRPQTLTWDGIAKEVPAHRATVIRWRNEIVKEVAIKIGWR